MYLQKKKNPRSEFLIFLHYCYINMYALKLSENFFFSRTRNSYFCIILLCQPKNSKSCQYWQKNKNLSIYWQYLLIYWQKKSTLKKLVPSTQTCWNKKYMHNYVFIDELYKKIEIPVDSFVVSWLHFFDKILSIYWQQNQKIVNILTKKQKIVNILTTKSANWKTLPTLNSQVKTKKIWIIMSK